MFIRSLQTISIAFGIAFPAISQPPPEMQKMMDEINSRPRFFWCTDDQAQFILSLRVKVDGKIVGQFSIPVAKAKREEIPIEDPQKIAAYHFQLVKRGKRKFRGVSQGPIEGNFWVGLATDTEIHFGHSWVCGNQIVLHEILPFTIGEKTSYDGSGVQILATWSNR
jgi:hypothetical protein